jgi:hypothetical protein
MHASGAKMSLIVWAELEKPQSVGPSLTLPNDTNIRGKEYKKGKATVYIVGASALAGIPTLRVMWHAKGWDHLTCTLCNHNLALSRSHDSLMTFLSSQLLCNPTGWLM